MMHVHVYIHYVIPNIKADVMESFDNDFYHDT